MLRVADVDHMVLLMSLVPLFSLTIRVSLADRSRDSLASDHVEPSALGPGCLKTMTRRSYVSERQILRSC
jgi:hypothetical protein